GRFPRGRKRASPVFASASGRCWRPCRRSSRPCTIDMKIRIGVGAGGALSTPGVLAELVTGLDRLGFDSLWLSEVLTAPVLDPVVGLAWAASSNPRLKLGTTMLLPGRNVLRLAKQLASLDVLCEGRLPSLCTPEEAAAGRVVIDEAAARAGRSISREHFGVSIGYAHATIDPATARVMTARRPRSVELTPVGLPALRKLIERFIAAGFSKFVVRPVVAPVSWRAELETLSASVGDLQT